MELTNMSRGGIFNSNTHDLNIHGSSEDHVKAIVHSLQKVLWASLVYGCLVLH